jgi:hypothetical protein
MPTTHAQVRAYLEPEEPDYTAAAAALGPDALPALEALVQDVDSLLASKAAYLASLIPDERAARVLEQAAQSRDATVRVAAAAGLQRRPEVTDEVAVDLMTDEDQGVRKVAAKAGRMTPALRELIAERAASDQDPSRRAAARAAIESVGFELGTDHGGGSSEPTGGGSAAPGEGGGVVGTEHVRDGATQTGDVMDDESGGGGDLGSGLTHTDRGGDGPDGGGSIDGGAGDIEGVSPHGGGRI